MEFSKFKVNHLVTFTSRLQQQQQTYIEAIKRLQEVEEVIGVWRQRVYILLNKDQLNILDIKSNEVIEQFPIIAVRRPEAIDYSTVYNNLLIFSVYLSKHSTEMHIFDCRSNIASKIVDEINEWRKKCLKSSPRMVSTYPVVNEQQKELKTYALIDKKNKKDSEIFKSKPIVENKTKVKETVNVFNQIAIERQKNDKIEKIICSKDETDSENKSEIMPNKLKPFRYF
jgi:hypothetical protein